MITVITGAPGSGKTAYAVNELLNLLDLAKREQVVRPIIVHGINGIRLPVRRAYCRSESCEICEAVPDEKKRDFVENWHEWAPDNAIFVLDECHEIFPVYRSTSSKEPPEFIKAFHKHRHRGLDFLMLSQHPSMIDTYLQKQASIHKHLSANWGRRYVMEYPKVNTSLTESAAAGTKSTYTLPSRVFDLYKSATGHHAVKRKKPIAVYAFAACMLLIALIGYRIYHRITEISGDKTAEAPASNQVTTPTAPAAALPPKPVPVLDFNPRYEGYPESAPAYDSVRQVKTFPRINGCAIWHAENRCTCYTQQGTQYPTTVERCLAWSKNHDFNPYESPEPLPQTVAVADIKPYPIQSTKKP